MMRFKVDENLPQEAAAELVLAGHDALTVPHQRMSGTADPELIRVCDAELRTLITLDLDFADIRVYPPSEHSGIVVLRPANQAKMHVLQLLRQAIPTLPADGLPGKLWIVDGAGIRTRE
jgi:predicted nuclease of predicted toxin-antitoxin system